MRKKATEQPISTGMASKRRSRGENLVLFPEMTENPWSTANGERAGERRKRIGGLTTLELCAGGGGQALGYEQAGIDHAALVELDRHACSTLRLNRPDWRVIEQDLNCLSGSEFKGVDIISGGLPCPPFSIAGKQLGTRDERNLFPVMIRLVDEIRPRAVMIENVRGILDAVFEDYRQYIAGELSKLGYQPGWKLMNASDFGVPQLRPRVVFVAVRKEYSEHFSWPSQTMVPLPNGGRSTRRSHEGEWMGRRGCLVQRGKRNSADSRGRFAQTRWSRSRPNESAAGMGVPGRGWYRYWERSSRTGLCRRNA